MGRAGAFVVVCLRLGTDVAFVEDGLDVFASAVSSASASGHRYRNRFCSAPLTGSRHLNTNAATAHASAVTTSDPTTPTMSVVESPPAIRHVTN